MIYVYQIAYKNIPPAMVIFFWIIWRGDTSVTTSTSLIIFLKCRSTNELLELNLNLGRVQSSLKIYVQVVQLINFYKVWVWFKWLELNLISNYIYVYWEGGGWWGWGKARALREAEQSRLSKDNPANNRCCVCVWCCVGLQVSLRAMGKKKKIKF